MYSLLHFVVSVWNFCLIHPLWAGFIYFGCGWLVSNIFYFIATCPPTPTSSPRPISDGEVAAWWTLWLPIVILIAIALVLAGICYGVLYLFRYTGTAMRTMMVKWWA